MSDVISKKIIYAPRPLWSRKGDFGAVLVIGGSKCLTGSPIFNAMAALRSGADLAYLIGHKRAMHAAAQYSPDLIAEPLEGEFTSVFLPRVLKRAERVHAIIIGGALARTTQTYQAIRRFISKCELPLAIDAEAIRAIGEKNILIKSKKVIFTPHADEFYALTGVRVKPSISDRKEKVLHAAKKIKAVILLKGAVDVISDGKRVMLNSTGTPFMTKGGFGDTLAGICGALLARGIVPFDAACAAAYINGKAGEYASKEYGEGVLASDMFEYIPKVIFRGFSIRRGR